MEEKFPRYPLVELHAHLGASINPSILWKIAQTQGIKLTTRNFEDFKNYISIDSSKNMTLNDYLSRIYHTVLDPLSSGTYAVEEATYEIMSGAYRNGIDIIELRANPMKHNNEGRSDLDYIILAMLRGMERALLEYPTLCAGVILCCAREFTFEQNSIIIEKAIKYHRRGVVGIDFAGMGSSKFSYKDYEKVVRKAKKSGLGITVHTGEVKDANDMWDALTLNPDRIGHGVLAYKDVELMKELSKRKTVLEVCPGSNIATLAVSNYDEFKKIFGEFQKNNVLFTINTDWPEIIPDAHLWRQYMLLRDAGVLSEKQLEKCTDIARKAAFVKKSGIGAYL